MTKLDYINPKGNTILGRIKLIHVLIHVNLSSLTLIEIGADFWFGLFFFDFGVVSYYQ